MKIRAKQCEIDGGALRREAEAIQTNGSRLIRKGSSKYFEKVDRYYDLTVELTEAEAEFKRKYKVKQKEAEDLKAEFIEAMKSDKLTELVGEKAKITPKKRSIGEISPMALLQFLKSIGQKAKFWQYVTVAIGAVKKDWGENTLIEAGILHTEVNEYSSIEVSKL